MKGLSSLLAFWHAALSDPRGRRIHTSDRKLLMQRLYLARKESKDEDLKALSIVFPASHPNELWIVKREPDNAPSSL